MPDDTMPPTPPEPPLYRVPSHGHGRLRVIRPGESGNPTGRNGHYGEVQRLCREAGPAVAKRLIEIALDPNEETRVSVVAAQEVLNRGFGRPREMPEGEGRGPGLNLEGVPEERLLLIIKALELAKAAKAAQAEGGEGDGAG